MEIWSGHWEGNLASPSAGSLSLYLERCGTHSAPALCLQNDLCHKLIDRSDFNTYIVTIFSEGPGAVFLPLKAGMRFEPETSISQVSALLREKCSISSAER